MQALLQDKSVLITGGTQGLGLAVAEAAAREGASSISIVGRDEQKAERAVAAIRQEAKNPAFTVVSHLADLGQPGEAERCVAEHVREFGRIDSLVNAAGNTSRGTLLDTSRELLDAHLQLNTVVPFMTMQAAVRDMRERTQPGTIVNILSMVIHGGPPFLAPYVASKAALAALTKNAAHAYRFDRIRINGLNIGWTATPGENETQRTFHHAEDDWLQKASAAQPMGKLGQPDEIADAVVFLLSERSGVVTGAILDWDQTVLGGSD